ncbi:MAG: hypothetical protein HY938_00105 [Nitrosomonadales bacterium]|nr:hypothetical protein [Nitrosomonadales bacterium]
MRALHALSLISALSLVGCDRLSGAADQKIMDAQAVGYACRVSQKTPEDCMKENEIHSPTYVLLGWKQADKEINERLLDPTMGKRAANAPAAAEAAAAHATPAAPAAEPHNAPADAKGASIKPEIKLPPIVKAPDTKVLAADKKKSAEPGAKPNH